jgi:hypothetical protein
MTPQQMMGWIQTCPPEVMSEISRMCLRTATEGIAEMLRDQARSPEMQAVSGPYALEAAANTIMRTNAQVWGGSA